MLAVIHDACDDLRFRVREVAPVALAAVAAKEGDGLLEELAAYMDGYFHAAAVLTVLATTSVFTDGEAVASLVGAALVLIDGSPRAAARWPGYKALLVALEKSLAPIALRAGTPVLDVIAGFRSTDPHLRELLTRALTDKKLRARLGDEQEKALAALAGQKKAPRDPRSLPRPTRKRGGGRRR